MAAMEDNTVGVIETGPVVVEAIGGLIGLHMMGMIEVVELSGTRRSIK